MFCCFQCVHSVAGNKSLQKMWCTSATQCRLIELQYLKDWFTFLSCSLIHISSFPCSFPFSCSAVHQLFFFSVFQTDFSKKKRFWSKNKGKDFLPASKSRRNDHSEENLFQYLFGALFVFEDRNEQCEPVL